MWIPDGRATWIDQDGLVKNVINDVTLREASNILAGIKYLRGLKKFSCVGILGHSEGGSIAYMLGAGGNADFIVSLAGPACKVDTLMMLQLNKLSRLQGAKGDVAHNVAETPALSSSASATAVAIGLSGSLSPAKRGW